MYLLQTPLHHRFVVSSLDGNSYPRSILSGREYFKYKEKSISGLSQISEPEYTHLKIYCSSLFVFYPSDDIVIMFLFSFVDFFLLFKNICSCKYRFDHFSIFCR